MKINHFLIKSFYPLLFIACQNNFSTDHSADKIKEAFAVKKKGQKKSARMADAFSVLLKLFTE